MAIAIVALDVIVFARLVPEVRSVGTRPFWTGALWALYGGLSEEIVLRYGAMSLHLAATAALVPLTPAPVTRTVVLVGIAGVVFGWLYWRRGLEAAIAAHAATSLIAHLAVPALGF